ncbi:MAG: AAA family ATPase [Lachnospiraceae bacterium]|nr:AAA family ATPase [uncultured Acetatifactor sp.]MCI9221498.1 AAA family ATPase [Lachnospiraceae bacterium]
MGKTISIGAQSFEFIRKNECFFVDKTGFIKEWWENADAVTLITRPRRFGKTLNLDMMNCFFSRTYEGRGELFEGLFIWEDKFPDGENPLSGDYKYRKLQGSYPVIFLSFAGIKGQTFEETKQGIKYALERLYREHKYVTDRKGMDEKELEFFDSVSSKMPDDVAVLALKYLSDYLEAYYGQKVLIFLDEYDTPLQEAYVYGYWEELVGFIRQMFNLAFKTNPSMERAIMTGITRVSRESVFSDLNNLTVVTTTSEKYCTRFGFTEEEVFRALDLMGMPERREDVKQWYDGFTFGSQRDIYNPWSITNFLEEKELKPYWANSSSNRLVSLLIRQGNPQTKTIMEDLMKGGVLETEIDEEIIFDQLRKKYGAVWSMLLASGYLKVVDRKFSQETGAFIYHLELTNREVYMMFRNMIRDWFSGEDVPYNGFIKALLLNDIEAMNEFMETIALATFSSFDIAESAAKNDAPERFYHGFVLGLMVELKGSYEIVSNRESGFGRYDIMLIPREKGRLDPIVIEFKVRKPRREASLEETVAAALQQIEDKKYDMALLERGFEKQRIRHYGFAFEGKQVLIG